MRSGWVGGGLAATAIGIAAAFGPQPGAVDVVLEEGTNFALALSPDESTLVLDLQGTLWRLPVAGGEASALTDGLGDDRLPDWSPDGERIVFQSFRAGSWDLWVVPAAGGTPRRITEGPADDREPVWAPDGRRVAFSSDRGGTYDVFVLDTETGGIEAVVAGPGNEFQPSFSPDGRRLAYVAEGETPEAEAWIVDLATGERRRLAAMDGAAASPSFDRRGRRVALRRMRFRPLTIMGSRFHEGIASDLVVVSVDGGEATALTDGEDVFPFRAAWTAGGDLLYTADGKIRRRPARDAAAPPAEIAFRAAVRLERPPYRRRRPRLVEAGASEPVRGIVRPAIAPDGATIALTALGDLWIVPVEGGTPNVVTRDEFLDSDPSWSPDGRHLVYASDREGTMDLWVKEVGSAPRSGERRITAGPGAEVGPAWSPDGSLVAFLDDRNDVYVVDPNGGEPRRVHETRGWASLPSWSPDGRYLAFAVQEPVSTRFREGANRIRIVSVADGAARTLAVPEKSFGTRDGDGPVWSPDGRALALALDAALWVLPVTAEGEPNGPLRRVADEPGDFLAWSPDGRWLYYVGASGLRRVETTTGTREDVPLDFEYRTPSAAGKLLLRGARLVDGTGAPARGPVDVLVEGQTIARIAAAGTIETDPDDAVRIVDVEGKTVLPGLIEMHTHLGLPFWGSRQGRVWLAFGVTSLRTPSAPLYRALEERESIEAGRRIGPRVFLTGYSLDGDRIYYTGALAIDDEAELDREIDRQLGLGVDLLKTYVRLPDALQKRAVERAHRDGVFVTSHELYPAVAFGIDGIEHLRGTSRRGFSPKLTDLRRSYGDVVRLVARSGVYLTPTLLIQGGYRLALAREPALVEDPRLEALFPRWARPAAGPGPADDRDERAAIVRPLLDTVGAIDAAGGRILAGTDSPIVPYGLSLVLEIEQLAEAGLGPLGAIEAATRRAAEALGVEGELGTVEEGKRADLLVVEGDPSRDIRALRRVHAVVVDGRLLTVDQLLRPSRR